MIEIIFFTFSIGLAVLGFIYIVYKNGDDSMTESEVGEKVDEILKEAEKEERPVIVDTDDKGFEEHMKTGYSYFSVSCPHCEKELWVEHLGLVTGIIDSDENKHLYYPSCDKDTHLKMAQGKLEEAEKIFKMEV